MIHPEKSELPLPECDIPESIDKSTGRIEE
jgi:hypothetical protein